MDYGTGELIYGYEYYINKGLRYRNNQGSRRGVTVKISINVDLEKQSHSIYNMDNHHFNDWFSISSGYRLKKLVMFWIEVLSRIFISQPRTARCQR